MRKLLLIAAILLFIACFIAGMLAVFNMMGYHNALDVAAVLAALGAACLIIRSKL